MLDVNTQRLIDYWRSLCGGRALPDRADVEPSGFVALANRVFIAELRSSGEIAFRFAGEAIEELHGMPLKGVGMSQFWRPAHREGLERAIRAALARASPLVVGAQAASADGTRGALEILFAPLTGPTGVADRILGLYQAGRGASPVEPPVRELWLRRLDGADHRPPQRTLRLASVNGERIA